MHYRDIAEDGQTEEQKLKHELEKVELVRNVWRNKVMEGGSRSGMMLRAALISVNVINIYDNYK